MEARGNLDRVLAVMLWPMLLLLLLLPGARTAGLRERAVGGGGGSGTGPPAASATKAVMVGAHGRVFSPNLTVAAVGDVVEFSFYPGNHSVVRAAYMFPCVPFETTGAGKTGFWSGFFAEKSPTPGRWRLTITDPTPIFFYSSGPDDCDRYGMVGGINVDSGELEMQRSMAVDSPTVVQPTGGSSPNGGPSGSSGSPAPSPPPAWTLPAGAIAGISIGAAASVALLGFLLYTCGRNRGDYHSRRRHMLFPLGRMGGGGGGGRGTPSPSPPPTPNKESSSLSHYRRGSSQHNRHHNRDGSSNRRGHRGEERTSSTTFLPTRGGTISGAHGGSSNREGGGGGAGTAASRAGTRSSVGSSTNTASPFVAPASAVTGANGTTNTTGGGAQQQQQQSPPAVVAGAPIVDGDTIYVAVKRSDIVSGEFGNGNGNGNGTGGGSCCSAGASPPASPLSAIMPLPLAVPSAAAFSSLGLSHHHRHRHQNHCQQHHGYRDREAADFYASASPGPSPVPTAAQLHHRRWVASQADTSDTESGVFGFGMARLATPRPPRGGGADASPARPHHQNVHHSPALSLQHVLLSCADEAGRLRLAHAATPPLLSLAARSATSPATAPAGRDGCAGTVTAAAAGTSDHGVNPAGAELGSSSMLNGTAASLFPYNNDRCVLEARGALSAVKGSGREPSELSG